MGDHVVESFACRLMRLRVGAFTGDAPSTLRLLSTFTASVKNIG